jgi:hypothetical protein
MVNTFSHRVTSDDDGPVEPHGMAQRPPDLDFLLELGKLSLVFVVVVDPGGIFSVVFDAEVCGVEVATLLGIRSREVRLERVRQSRMVVVGGLG